MTYLPAVCSPMLILLNRYNMIDNYRIDKCWISVFPGGRYQIMWQVQFPLKLKSVHVFFPVFLPGSYKLVNNIIVD